MDSLQRLDERGVRVVVDFADGDTAGGPGWLRRAGQDHESVGVFLARWRRREVAEDREAETRHCASESDYDHGDRFFDFSVTLCFRTGDGWIAIKARCVVIVGSFD